MDVSREYGADPRYVLLGGGNTSLKDGDYMFVKASGTKLGTIGEDGFVKMSLPALAKIWDKKFSQDKDKREEEVLADMMASRAEGENKRPSVEALLHSFIPYTYVVHLHPALVNGMTCGQSGKDAAKSLFPDSLWIPLVNPGYILASVVREAALKFKAEKGFFPKVIFLQNHGVFVGADTIEEIRQIYDGIMSKLGSYVVRKPNFDEEKADKAKLDIVRKGISEYFGVPEEKVSAVFNKELAPRLKSEDAFRPYSSAFTPDHIVYSGFKPLWIPASALEKGPECVRGYCEEYLKKNGVKPKVVAVEGTGVFAADEKAMLLFLDTIKVAAFAETFGGYRFMDDDQIDFIRTWEVEKYRASQSK